MDSDCNLRVLELGTLGHIVVTAVKVNYEKKVNFDGCYVQLMSKDSSSIRNPERGEKERLIFYTKY